MAQKTIHLKYDLAKWTLTASTQSTTSGSHTGAAATTATDVKPGQMSAIRAKQGDSLEWVMDTPGITDFIVHLEPASAFQPAAFSSGSGPVKIVKPIKKAHAYCGFVSDGKLYGYPKDKTYGHSIET